MCLSLSCVHVGLVSALDEFTLTVDLDSIAGSSLAGQLLYVSVSVQHPPERKRTGVEGTRYDTRIRSFNKEFTIIRLNKSADLSLSRGAALDDWTRCSCYALICSFGVSVCRSRNCVLLLCKTRRVCCSSVLTRIRNRCVLCAAFAVLKAENPRVIKSMCACMWNVAWRRCSDW
jgi:hypothetical protein